MRQQGDSVRQWLGHDRLQSTVRAAPAGGMGVEEQGSGAPGHGTAGVAAAVAGRSLVLGMPHRVTVPMGGTLGKCVRLYVAVAVAVAVAVVPPVLGCACSIRVRSVRILGRGASKGREGRGVGSSAHQLLSDAFANRSNCSGAAPVLTPSGLSARQRWQAVPGLGGVR